MGRVRVLLLAAVACGALTVSASQQSPSPPTGFILGRVVDARSNSPLASVVVTMTGAAAPVPGGPRSDRSVLTDAEGRFVFRGLVKGTYQLLTTIAGNGFSPNGFLVTGSGFPIGSYLNGGFGQTRPNGPRQPIELADGQRITDAVIRMWKTAAIGGHVLDEAGEPVVGQVVGVVELSSNGRLLNGPTLQTDDRGAYRFGSLAPGTYVVFVPQTAVSMPASIADELSAAPPDPLTGNRYSQAYAPSPSLGGIRVGTSLVSTTPDPVRFPRGTMFSNALPLRLEGGDVFAYATTFYPSAASVSQASRITVAAGDERSQMDVHLRPVRTVPVSGVLVDNNGPVPGFGLHLMPADAGEDASILETATTATDSRGAFVFPAVPSGQYTAIAWRVGGVPTGNPKQPMLEPTRVAERPGAWAMQSIAVGNRAVENVTVTLRPAVSVSGRVELTGASTRPRTRPFLTIPRARSLFRTPGPASGAGIDFEAGGTFFVRDVSPPGRFAVGAPSLPAPWTLQSITLGGRDITDVTFLIEQEDIADLVITYTDTPAALAGSVESANADLDASVFVLPADRARWPNLRPGAFRLVRPSTTGSFTIPALPPGEYLVGAIRDDLAHEWPDARFLERLVAVSRSVRVTAGQTTTVAVKVSELR